MLSTFLPSAIQTVRDRDMEWNQNTPEAPGVIALLCLCVTDTMIDDSSRLFRL